MVKLLKLAILGCEALFFCLLSLFSLSAFAQTKTQGIFVSPVRIQDNSQFISQSAPVVMQPSVKYQVSLTFKNSGKTVWRKGLYALGTQNNVWLIKEVELLNNEIIKPGQSKTFSFEISAPTKSSSYDFQWQMFRRISRYKAFFGQKSVKLTIKINSPLVFDTLNNQSTYEHKLLQFKVAAKDPDNNILNYTVSNLPLGAAFDNSTQIFSWNPEHGQAGTYLNVHLQVSDGIATAAKDITITVLKTVVFGTIYEKNQAGQNVPLEGVSIDIMDLTRTNIIASGITDVLGHFDVFYEAWVDGTYFIRASKAGYKTYCGVATLRGNSMMPFSVTLVENVSPTGSIKINNDAQYTNSTSVILTLSASDAGSGMGVGAQMQFSNDNATWSTPETYSTTKSWDLVSGEGEKTVYVKFKDVAGNWSQAYSDTITLDTTAPELNIISPLDNEVIRPQ